LTRFFQAMLTFDDVDEELLPMVPTTRLERKPFSVKYEKLL
jgi:hypothetical protein